MSAELLQNLSIGAFALSGVLWIVTIVLFVRMDIRGLVNELNGKTAKLQIEELREQNRKMPSNRSNGIFFGNTERKQASEADTGEQRYDASASRGTEASGEEGTMLLSEEEGTVLLSEEDGTTLLEKDTVLLHGQTAQLSDSGGLIVVLDEMVIHTEERI